MADRVSGSGPAASGTTDPKEGDSKPAAKENLKGFDDELRELYPEIDKALESLEAKPAAPLPQPHPYPPGYGPPGPAGWGPPPGWHQAQHPMPPHGPPPGYPPPSHMPRPPGPYPPMGPPPQHPAMATGPYPAMATGPYPAMATGPYQAAPMPTGQHPAVGMGPHPAMAHPNAPYAPSQGRIPAMPTSSPHLPAPMPPPRSQARMPAHHAGPPSAQLKVNTPTFVMDPLRSSPSLQLPKAIEDDPDPRDSTVVMASAPSAQAIPAASARMIPAAGAPASRAPLPPLPMPIDRGDRERTAAYSKPPVSQRSEPYRASPEPKEVLITLQEIVKTFDRNGYTLRILQDVNLKIRKGSFDALMGPSGSGKSTLLNIIAGLDRATSGIIEIGGVRMDSMSEQRLGRWRADNIGFVYQQYNLIPVMTALENVELPLLLTNVKRKERRVRAQTALRIVGLEDRMGHFPRQLSGGQEQRVAIARAIVNDPAIIVADEPTGDLDRKAADDILLVLEKLATELNKTIVMVTHDPEAASRAFVQHRLEKGVVVTR